MEFAAVKKKVEKDAKDKKIDKRESDGNRIRAAALVNMKRKADVDVDINITSAKDTDKRAKKDKTEGRSTGLMKEAAAIVSGFTSMMENANKLKEDELETSRYLLDKAEREARFQLEKVEREAQLDFMRSTMEMMRFSMNKQ
ncbi:hypothetical protein ACHHYP_10697 [Achlya hypogyna]|uniref:No apical meristem-associated C-terminal domain-containing protein n=1 Tax=Achlya hypogyna TaxID=1202772 RepID=A0A1V9YKQ7_ACHHY|nr:hypothetical protein ACHHYP_10697 [Achlya hypogyna]